MASGRSLLRRRRRTDRRLHAACALAAFAFIAAPAFPQQESDSAKGSALLDRFLDEVTTLTADFVQTVQTGADVETQTGRRAAEPVPLALRATVRAADRGRWQEPLDARRRARAGYGHAARRQRRIDARDAARRRSRRARGFHGRRGVRRGRADVAAPRAADRGH